MNKKLISIIIALALITVVVMSTKSFENPRGREYYKNIGEVWCVGRDKSCCQESLSYMKDNGYLLTTAGVCGPGKVRNTLKCPGSFEWCEPVKD